MIARSIDERLALMRRQAPGARLIGKMTVDLVSRETLRRLGVSPRESSDPKTVVREGDNGGG